MGITVTAPLAIHAQEEQLSTATKVLQIRIVSAMEKLGAFVTDYLKRACDPVECIVTNSRNPTPLAYARADIAVYIPALRDSGLVPDLAEAESVLSPNNELKATTCILISSTAIYGADFNHPGLVSETCPLPSGDRSVVSQWLKLEGLAARSFNRDDNLTILRCATVLSHESPSPIVRLFKGRTAITMPGHDPSLQLLSPGDLAQAIQHVVQKNLRGMYNVTPDQVIPLHKALRHSGIQRIPIPRTLQRVARRLVHGKPAHHDYQRYSWTASNAHIKHSGFVPQSSVDTLADFLQRPLPNEAFDDFGMDKQYIDFYGRTLFRFLADWYWRIEVTGTQHIPQNGRGILTGIHRGFMPWDGVMALHLTVRETRRYPRFLIHPGLVKFPFLANFMTKLGGIIACQQNAAHVLERDELLGVFPEGIHGAFVRYSQAYKIGSFHRDSFVKIALRHRAPIIPFVTVGSAEIFPIMAKLKARWWTQYTEWPAFPITPTFPLIPLPLPSKWHTRFLPAMHIEQDYPESAATNTKVVRSISNEIRRRMQQAIDEMLQRRRSVFWGSIFSAEPK